MRSLIPIGIMALAFIGVGAYALLSHHEPPKLNDASALGSITATSTPAAESVAQVNPDARPTCTINTPTKAIVSADQHIPFSWTSTNAEVIIAETPLTSGESELPPSGEGEYAADTGLIVTKPGEKKPYSVTFKFTAQGEKGSGICWLAVPIQL